MGVNSTYVLVLGCSGVIGLLGKNGGWKTAGRTRKNSKSLEVTSQATGRSEWAVSRGCGNCLRSWARDL